MFDVLPALRLPLHASSRNCRHRAAATRAKLAEAALARYMCHVSLTEKERAKQVAELDAGIQECNVDEARYQAANQPENVAKVVAQRDALRKLRAELLAAKVTE
jgi:hypothetical protein